MPPVQPQPTPPTPSPQGAAAGAQGQPPSGSSPVTGPTANRGFEVVALKMAAMGLMAFEKALPLAGASSELGQALLKTIQSVSKFVPPGAVTPADLQMAMKKMMDEQQQFGQQMNQMRQQPPQAAAPQGAPGGAPPQQAKAA